MAPLPRGLGPSLSQRLAIRQAPVMTPQLQQAIKLLQLSHLELESFVDQALAENPLLQRGDGAEEVPAADLDADAKPSADTTAALAAPETLAEADDARDTDQDNLWNGDEGDQTYAPSASSGESAYAGGADDSDRLARIADTAVSLRDHIGQQIEAELHDAAERVIAWHLLEALDANGYFTGDLDEAAAQLGCTGARAETLLRKLQSFDPAGVFARDLKECLALQLRERNRFDPAIEALLNNLELVARRDIARLSRLCGVDEADVTDMIGELRALNPRPGTAFDTGPIVPVVPDVLVRATGKGAFVVELNPETLPNVLIDRTYLSEIGAAPGKEAKKFVAEHVQTANWLIKALHQRSTTLLKVATEIVRQQQHFLAHGVEQLRPLTLKDVAGAVEMHESTVSRAAANKFMATPRGIFEFKYFFTTAIADTTGGAAHSAETVRQKIKSLVTAEGGEVLSDDALVDRLRQAGYDVARRTVAKYRESLGIASSFERKRERRTEPRSRSPDADAAAPAADSGALPGLAADAHSA